MNRRNRVFNKRRAKEGRAILRRAVREETLPFKAKYLLGFGLPFAADFARVCAVYTENGSYALTTSALQCILLATDASEGVDNIVQNIEDAIEQESSDRPPVLRWSNDAVVAAYQRLRVAVLTAGQL